VDSLLIASWVPSEIGLFVGVFGLESVLSGAPFGGFEDYATKGARHRFLQYMTGAFARDNWHAP
jgi:hypothetical protein